MSNEKEMHLAADVGALDFCSIEYKTHMEGLKTEANVCFIQCYIKTTKRTMQQVSAEACDPLTFR